MTILCVAPTATLRHVAGVLIDNSIGAVVVGSQDSPAGIVAARDLLGVYAGSDDSSDD